MTTPVRGYLTDLGRQFNLGDAREREILDEIEDHVEDSARELMDEGLPTEDALNAALSDMGATKTWP